MSRLTSLTLPNASITVFQEYIHPKKVKRKLVMMDMSSEIYQLLPCLTLENGRPFIIQHKPTTFHALLQVEIRYSFYSLDDS